MALKAASYHVLLLLVQVFFLKGGGGGGGLSTVCETALVYFCYVAVVVYMKVLFGCWVAGNTHDGRSGETDR